MFGSEAKAEPQAPAIDVKWGPNIVGHYPTSNAFLPGLAVA